jgi:cyclopropane fatty-acyl-phospholipid synthase-like methyltransferase
MNRMLARGIFVVLVLAAVGFYGWSGWRDYTETATTSDTFRAPDIPYAPTPPAVVDRMLQAARLEKDDVLYDLGSGDGRIVISAAAQYGVRAQGIDLDADLVARSRAAARTAGVEDLTTFVRGDLLAADLSPASVVTLSLNDDLNRRLVPRLEQMGEGATVISHGHGIADFAPDKLVRFRDEAGGREHLIYVYILPFHAGPKATPVERPGDSTVGLVATPEPIIDEMLTMAHVEEGDLVIDLGSGDGRILLTAARQYGARAIGYEINPDLVALSREKVDEAALGDRVDVREGNLFDADLSTADVVTLYLSETMNEKLLPQFDTMKPGARIVSHDFDIPGVRQQTVVKVTPGGAYNRQRTIYMWTTPLERLP